MDFAGGAIPKSHADVATKINIEADLRGIGLKVVETVDPLKLPEAVECVMRVSEEPGVKAIIFKSPCIALCKTEKKACVRMEKCIDCKKCIRSLGCPALTTKNGRVWIDQTQCTGCMLCAGVCPVNAIEEKD